MFSRIPLRNESVCLYKILFFLFSLVLALWIISIFPAGSGAWNIKSEFWLLVCFKALRFEFSMSISFFSIAFENEPISIKFSQTSFYSKVGFSGRFSKTESFVLVLWICRWIWLWTNTYFWNSEFPSKSFLSLLWTCICACFVFIISSCCRVFRILAIKVLRDNVFLSSPYFSEEFDKSRGGLIFCIDLHKPKRFCISSPISSFLMSGSKLEISIFGTL